MNLNAFNNLVGWIVITAVGLGVLSALVTVEVLYLKYGPNTMIPGILQNILIGAGSFVITIISGLTGAHILSNAQKGQS